MKKGVGVLSCFAVMGLLYAGAIQGQDGKEQITENAEVEMASIEQSCLETAALTGNSAVNDFTDKSENCDEESYSYIDSYTQSTDEILTDGGDVAEDEAVAETGLTNINIAPVIEDDTDGYQETQLDINTPKYTYAVSGEELPSSYHKDLADLSVYSTIRDQGPWGTCWAFATTGAAEFNAITNGLVTNDINLSEFQLAYFTYHKQDDPMKNLTGDGITMVGDQYLTYGGNVGMAINILANWKGYTDEADNTDLEYDANYVKLTNKLHNRTLTESDAFDDHKLIVTGSRLYDITNDPDGTKQAIMDNGGLAISYYEDTAYHSTDGNFYCYDDNKETNHAVMVVGWDDDFAAENFTNGSNSIPEGDGAWLVRNSWGASSDSLNSYGYFWMSYYDKSLNDTAYAIQTATADTYDNNYQYDGGIQASYWGVFPTVAKSANVYEVNGEAGADEEILKAVGFTVSNLTDAHYKIEIYTNLSDKSDPTSGTLQTDLTTEGDFVNSGYYTVELSNSALLYRGDCFSVVLTLTQTSSDSGTNYSFPDMEAASGNGTVSCPKNSSFMYYGNSWSSCANRYSKNWRLKAFTCDVQSSEEGVYGIQFDGNGATSGSMDAMTKLPIDTTITLKKNEYIRPGYDFTGWNTEADGTGVSYADEESVKNLAAEGESAVLYAQWTPISYYVAFDANGGSGDMSELDCTYGEAFKLTECSMNNGSLVFNGWNTASDGSGTWYYDGQELKDLVTESSTISLYAQWADNDSLYVLDDDGLLSSYTGHQTELDLPEETISILSNAFYGMDCIHKVNLPEGVYCLGSLAFGNCVNLSVVTGGCVSELDDMVFSGCSSLESVPEWNDIESMGSLVFNDCVALTSVTIKGSYTSLYGTFKNCAKLASVDLSQSLNYIGEETFDGCSSLKDFNVPYFVTTIDSKAFYGCTGLTDIKIYSKVETISRDALPETDDTLTFTLTEGSYTDTYIQSLKLYTSGKYKIAYRESEPLEYTVFFDGNGADTGSMNNQEFTADSEYKLNKNIYERSNYTFIGWNTMADGSGESFEDEASITSPLTDTDGALVTLFAQWKPDQRKVLFVADYSGTLDAQIDTEYKYVNYGEAYGSLPTPVCTGYTFLGWYTEQTDGTLVTEETVFSEEADQYLYAHYRLISYKVSYVLNGGTNSSANPCEYAYDSDSIALLAPTRSGYTFLGWYTDAGFTNKITAIDGSYASNITLYAKWSKNEISETLIPKKIVLSKSSYVYDGKAKKPTIKVLSTTGKTISAATYKVTYSSDTKSVGKKTVKVKFTSVYSGTLSNSYVILPKGTTISKLKAGSKCMTVSLKKQKTQTTGYLIQYSTNSKFTKNLKTVTVNNKTTSVKISKLKKGTKYYVRICTYKKVNGKKYCSAWSKTKYVKVK